jgi:hypothetical protein
MFVSTRMLHKITLHDRQSFEYKIIKNFLLSYESMATWKVFKSLQDLREFLNSDSTEILYQGI